MDLLKIAAMVLASLGVQMAVGFPPAHAEYPDRPIRMIVGFAPGGQTDVVARVLSEGLKDRLGQPVIVENRPGAGGAVGGLATANLPPDGYTFFIGGISIASGFAINPAMQLDPMRDLIPIALLLNEPFVMVVNRDIPAKTVQEFVDYAKGRPGQTYASSGIGTGLHFAGERFKLANHLSITHVPYRGEAPALNDVAAGQVPMMISSVTAALPLIQAGLVRAIGLAGRERVAQLPDVPTMAEAGFPDFLAAGWFGLEVAQGTPVSILDRIEHEVREVLDSPKTVEQYARLGVKPPKSDRASFAKFFQSEIDNFRAIAAASNIKAE